MNTVFGVRYKREMQETLKKFDAIVIGLGLTGMSCVRHLSGVMSSLAVVDTRENPPQLDTLKKEFPKIPFFSGEFDQDLFCSAGLLIVSPGVPLSTPAIRMAKKNDVDISGDIELFLSEVQAPVVAITGSNGKSTVAKLVSEMITDAGKRVLLGGNFGKPALALLESEIPDFYVLELSSFQLECMKNINFIASTVLNISEDHMDRYKDFEEYVLAKKKIFMGNGSKVVNFDDPVVKKLVDADVDVMGFTLKEPKDGVFGLKRIDDIEWICFGQQKILKVSELQIGGRHNISNALAGLALGYVIGLKLEHMVHTLRQFKGLPHRCESVATVNEVEWINDSKGTNPGATCAAIQGVADGENIVLIAGGDAKGADLTSLSHIVKGRVHTAILIGKDAVILEQALSEHCRIVHAISLEAAVKTAKDLARPGDKVLLSPACSSLDMFSDYRERGEKFCLYVMQLTESGERG